uniref:Uncharacterized protein n=1 Tax=Acanthochromis polyacanthus TaxID=80966 RepID=A0A3Q1FS75_9TELE
MKYIIGISSVTNGGKTTLTNCLMKNLPNCCVVHQGDFFKIWSIVTVYYCSQIKGTDCCCSLCIGSTHFDFD